MKVAMVIDHLDAARGGGEVYATQLARGLISRGHEIHVFANTFRGDLEGIKIHHLPMISYPRSAKAVSLSVAARALIKREHFHVVEGFGATWHVDVHYPGGGCERAWLAGEIRSHKTPLKRFFAGLRLRLSLKLAVNLWIETQLYREGKGPLVLAPSRMVVRDLLRYYPAMNPSRIRLLTYGVDVIRFNPENRERWGRQVRNELGISQEQVVILFFAANFRLKGLGCLLSALDGEIPGNFVLLVAGRGRKKPYQNLVSRSRIPVLFLGAVERPEIILSAADLFVHPSFYDPCSIACLEAMASGLPVVTTPYTGASELLVEGVSGYLVSEPWDTSMLRERILALADRRLRESMGQEARKAVERLSTDWHMNQVEILYNEVVRPIRGDR